MYLYSLNACTAIQVPTVLQVAPSPCFCTVSAAGNGLHP